MSRAPTPAVVMCLVVLAACGSGEPGTTTTATTTTVHTTTTTTTVAMTVSAADLVIAADRDGCRLQGSIVQQPGPLEVALDNQTSELAFFELVAIGAGGSYDQLAAHVAAEAERLASGAEMAGPPTYMTQVARAEVAEGSQGTLSGEAERGIHAVVCGNPGVTITITEAVAVGEAPLARGYASLAHAGAGRGIVVCCGFPRTGSEDDAAVQADIRLHRADTGWVPIPAPTYDDVGDAIAYDSQSDRVIVYALTETWAYDPAAQVWENLRPSVMPEGLAGARMAYDSGSDRVILFGGTTASPQDDTWAYDYETNTWTEMGPDVRPPARAWPAMAYDAGTDRVVVFSGASDTDTWAYDYDRNTWEQLRPAVSPPAREYAQMACDPTSGLCFIFGGVIEGTEEPLGDTWAYDPAAEAWSQMTSNTSPSPRGWYGLAADPDTGLVVLFGGGPTRDAYTAETWAYDPAAGTWALVP